MAYCTYTEVEADFKDTTFTTTTNVKIADVTQFIVEADALINSYVGMRYSVPVTAGADALSLLKLYSRSLVANRIRSLLEVKQEKNTDANQNVRSGLSTANVLKLLEQIKNDEIKLDGATLLSSSSGFYSYNYENDIEPDFEKDCKEW